MMMATTTYNGFTKVDNFGTREIFWVQNIIFEQQPSFTLVCTILPSL
jgi:hypothetical protein